ncbi:MAG: hypothetical protein ABIJ39_13100 [Chloroflexota bacterium]
MLRATLKALQEIKTPGEVIHLPFEWQELPEDNDFPQPEPPPIATYLMEHPFQVTKLIRRQIPG